MYYPNLEDYGNDRGTIDAFAGYNHTPTARDGEWYDMRNLTSDEYPLFAPRSPRKVLLSLSSQEWEEQDITITAEYVGDISEQHCVYTTSVFPVDGVQRERFRCTVSEDIGEIRVRVIYMDADGEVLREDVYDEEPVIYESRGDVAQAQIELSAYPADGVTLDPEDINTYVYDIIVSVYNDHIRGMLIKNQRLAYLIGTRLYYDGQIYDFARWIPDDDRFSRQQLISYGAYILIFPLGLYFNTVNQEDMGYLGASFAKSNVTITMYPTDLYGKNISADITYSATDPGASTVGEGKYWIDASGDDVFMYQSTGTSWTPVSTCWMKITVPGNDVDLTQYFAEGDAVYMNTIQPYVNNGSLIQKIDAHSITVIAFPASSQTSQTFNADPFTIERRIPDLDYVCVSQNRVWGCFYGEKGGDFLNEIYACKQGDPKNWYDYTTLLGSYAVSIGSDGPWTGAVTYQGYPTFLKENAIYRVYGTLPSNYQVNTIDARGAQIGSERSVAVCGEYLIYKSMADICIFDGSTPVSISLALGSEIYTEAVAGSTMSKYFISMLNEAGEPVLLVYDVSRSMWIKQDELRIEEFCRTNSGQLYGQDGLSVYGFGLATDTLSQTAETAERYVSWFAESGDMGYEYPDHKYVQKLTIRARIPFKSEIRILLSVDDQDFEEMCVLRGNDRVQTQSIDLQAERCDHYRIRLEGHGDVRIYAITRTLDTGSEEYDH